MTVYDAAMVGVIVAGMIWGLFRGIVWQIASIASLFLGYFGSHTISAQIVDYFPGEPVVARSLAMISGYVGISAGVFLMAWLVRASLKKMKFEAFDKHLGMLLGGVEGALLGIVVTLFVVSLAPNSSTDLLESFGEDRRLGDVRGRTGPARRGAAGLETILVVVDRK